MKPYERILLIARPDLQRSPALRQAAVLARATGAALHIAVFDHSATLDLVARLRAEDQRGLRDTFLRQRRDWLAGQAADLRADGIEVTTEAVWSRHALDEILAHVVESGAALVVKDVEMRSGLRRVLMHALDWQLLRECPVPLLLVHSEQITPRRVIVAADALRGADDALNNKLFDHALGLAYATQARLHLAYAFALPAAAAADPAVMVTQELYETLRETHLDAFTALADAHGVPPERRHFLGGPPAAALARFARQCDADLLVLGAAQHSGLERLLFGSTAAAVLDELSCSVLVIKPDATERALRDAIAARRAAAMREAA
ncbi:universal stress protein [Solimonas soli]|uniref:universal stress protein n=1 Tax=Solimonas soli TaxID=413479 RepID=UPI0004B45E52|nr:universal stress protein [Solimonas soli]